MSETYDLDEIRIALKDPNVALHLVYTFTHGRAVQVKIKSRKIGPLILPSEGDTIADVLIMLGNLSIQEVGA